MLQGEADLRCPPADNVQLFVALRVLGRTVEYVLYPEESHVYFSRRPAGSPDRPHDPDAGLVRPVPRGRLEQVARDLLAPLALEERLLVELDPDADVPCRTPTRSWRSWRRRRRCDDASAVPVQAVLAGVLEPARRPAQLRGGHAERLADVQGRFAVRAGRSSRPRGADREVSASGPPRSPTLTGSLVSRAVSRKRRGGLSEARRGNDRVAPAGRERQLQPRRRLATAVDRQLAGSGRRPDRRASARSRAEVDAMTRREPVAGGAHRHADLVRPARAPAAWARGANPGASGSGSPR